MKTGQGKKGTEVSLPDDGIAGSHADLRRLGSVMVGRLVRTEIQPQQDYCTVLGTILDDRPQK